MRICDPDFVMKSAHESDTTPDNTTRLAFLERLVILNILTSTGMPELTMVTRKVIDCANKLDTINVGELSGRHFVNRTLRQLLECNFAVENFGFTFQTAALIDPSGIEHEVKNDFNIYERLEFCERANDLRYNLTQGTKKAFTWFLWYMENGRATDNGNITYDMLDIERYVNDPQGTKQKKRADRGLQE
jgi:hypothetical protein